MKNLIVLGSLMLMTAACTTGSPKKVSLSDRVIKCNFCSGYDKAGGVCDKSAGGKISNQPGGYCYAGPGGALYAGPGGSLSTAPGGLCSEHPGGNCYNGPGSDGKNCPLACRLNRKEQ